MGGGGRGWVALEAALAPARPRVAMSWRSRLVRPALVPLLWTVGSRWGRGVFVRCVSPVGRACAAWHSAPGAEGAASPKSGRSAAPAPPRAPAPPVRLPCRNGKSCLAFPVWVERNLAFPQRRNFISKGCYFCFFWEPFLFILLTAPPKWAEMRSSSSRGGGFCPAVQGSRKQAFPPLRWPSEPAVILPSHTARR